MHDTQHLSNAPGKDTKSSRSDQVEVSRPRFVAIKEHLYSDLNGEAVILSMRNGKYYGLNGVGKSIWILIKVPKGVDEIVSGLTSEYEVDEDVCRHEVQSFIEEMTGEGLIEVLDAKAK